MVVLSILSKVTIRFNRIAGPLLLRNGLRIRHILGRGQMQDNPYLDQILAIPWAQKIISLEVYQEISDRKKRSERTFDQWIEKSFDAVFGVGPDHEYLHKITDSELRLKVLEDYLRPVLVPNEKWSDVVRWQCHTRFLKWAREEFLAAKYTFALKEGLDKHKNLRQTPQIAVALQKQKYDKWFGDNKEDNSTTHCSHFVLPTSKTIIDAFGMQKWSRVKDEEEIFARMEKIAEELGGYIAAVYGSSMRIADIPIDTDVSNLSLEELLEIAGAHVASCGPFNVLCHERNIYQLWTKDYIRGFGEYLQERANSFDGETVILDVGAGDGLLGHLIRQELAAQSQSRLVTVKKKDFKGTRSNKVPTVCSVDDGSWKIEQKAAVEKIGIDAAIKKYTSDPSKQVLVLCSWMPAGVDWTASFRAGKVDEYILIGEYDDGNCGENWETWGSHEFLPENFQVYDLKVDKVTPYKESGYEKRKLENLQPYHFSRFDSADSSNSATFSFRRTV